jgi:hypothetical protein
MLNYHLNRRGLIGVLVTVLLMVTLLAATSGRVPAAGHPEMTDPGRPVGSDVVTFLPLLARQQPLIDLSLTGLETTQATQTAGMNVPLIAHRPALLRIFAETSAEVATAGVDLAITAARGGVPLAGSPLLLNGESVVPEARRDDLDSTINVLLPAGWLERDVDLHVTLDPQNTIPEWDEDNNQGAMDLSFSPVPPMNITIVPIHYTHTPNGQTYPPPSVDTISDFIRRTYPVSTLNVTFRTAYNFVGNLDEGLEWGRLLDEVTAVRMADAPPADVFYYGLVPVINGGGAWFDGGIAGFAWIGNPRAGVGLDLTPLWQLEYSGKLAAHEIGHNLNRRHAPCGVGSGLDPQYPYEQGQIGQVGVDVSVPQLFLPQTSYDFMSYCHPQWLSDYTYMGLLAGLTTAVPAGPAGQQDGLLVRAVLQGEEPADILPAYALSGRLSPLPEKSDYRLEMLDGTGEVLAAHPVQLLQAVEEGAERNMIAALLPLPAGERVAALRLVQNGRVLATRPLAAPAAATNITIAGDTLRWNADRPAMVRYSNDHGRTWLTLAVDAVHHLVLSPDLDRNNGEFLIIPSR